MRVKKILWLVGGLCAAGAGFLAWGARRAGPVEDFAHRGEDPKLGEQQFDEVLPDESFPDQAA